MKKVKKYSFVSGVPFSLQSIPFLLLYLDNYSAIAIIFYLKFCGRRGYAVPY